MMPASTDSSVNALSATPNNQQQFSSSGVRSLLDKMMPLPSAVKTLVLLFGVGASIGLCGWGALSTAVVEYSQQNDLPGADRNLLLATMLGLGASAVLAGFAFLARARSNAAQRLELAAIRLSPLLFVGLLPFLFRWQIWVSRELTLGVFVSAGGIAFPASVRASLRAAEKARAGVESPFRRAMAALLERAASWAPLTLVSLGAAAYALFFSYQTVLHHRSLLTSSFDMGLEDNLLWNLIHGGAFMKMSPLFGPVGSHFGYHATLFAYFIGPFYALYQHAEALLVFQAVMVALAAYPLYLFAARHVGRWPASLIALAYVLYPPVHGANLYDFHYPPLGVFFIWSTLYLVDSGRIQWAMVSMLLACSVREDIAADTAILGLYLIFARQARPGAIITAVAGAYFLFVKLVLMPPFLHGDQSFLNQWQGLVGRGSHGYAGVLMTVIGNPVFTLTSLLEPEKFLYLVQLGAPLCFFPWRRPIGYLLSIPGFFFTLLGTKYLPLVQISFQYTAHWTAFLFIAVVSNLERLREPRFPGDTEGFLRQRAWLITLCCLSLVCSYQYGAMFQQHTARGGFGPYEFGRSEANARRYEQVHKLIAKVPPMAKIVSSENIVPQVSNRPDSYTLRIGVFDAEYLLYQEPARDDERRYAKSALEGDFGVVATEGSFVLAKRGYDKSDNQRVLRRLH
ncbi:MAG TPA: DUF2079 domain-containing protein [Polyangiaceae bacterium]|nr:DUF2079 domain-containing protein [Polyangiaceae bacterium]